MELDLTRVAEFARRADTEDLLDRVTVYRGGMEPAAVGLLEDELYRRGVGGGAIADHWLTRRETVLVRPDGVAYRCSRCDRPAAYRAWGWHRLFGRLPLFPRRFTLCAEHAPKEATDPDVKDYPA